jgi:hypothetical protein
MGTVLPITTEVVITIIQVVILGDLFHMVLPYIHIIPWEDIMTIQQMIWKNLPLYAGAVCYT